MKKIVLSATAVLMALTLSAQQTNWSIGAKGGLNVPNITPGGSKTELSEGYSSRLAWGAGVFAEYRFNKTFSLTFGLEYSGQGGQKDGTQANPTDKYMAGMQNAIGGQFDNLITAAADMPGATAATVPTLTTVKGQLMTTFSGITDAVGQQTPYLYADYKSVAHFNYIMLPVQARAGWNFSQNSPWRVYVQAGLFAAYMFKAERVMSGESFVYTDKAMTQKLSQNAAVTGAFAALGGQLASIPDVAARTALTGFITNVSAGLGQEADFNQTVDITDDIKKFNFGFVGAVGISYTIAQRHSIFIEGGGNYGFIKIQKSDANGQNRIGAGVVQLGYSFRL